VALSVNWRTKVITIPQSDLDFVSGTLYGLDTNVFRLALKDIEDSEEGIPFLDTHRHNTEVTVSGVTFARTLEIINGYTVEFEEGQYSVLLSGSNNNIFDVAGGILVQNQVQIISANSAGLVNSGALTESRYKDLNFNKTNTIVGDKITKYSVNDEFDVNVTYDGDIPSKEETD